jgi:lipid-A-disaccharide synthase
VKIENNPVKIFACAGEVSGERALAQVLLALKPHIPHLIITGFGGIECKNAGLQSLAPLKKIAVNGIWDVLINFVLLLSLYRKTLSHLRSFHPDLVILVDYPGFNRKILKFCKQKGYPVYYIAPPQVWAYHFKNISIFKNVDVQVLFPLDIETYASAGARIAQGHFFKKPEITNTEKDVLCICPGSRLPVVKRNLPLLLKLLNTRVSMDFKNLKPVVLVPEEIYTEAHKLLQNYPYSQEIEICTSGSQVFSRAKYALANPGSITVELGLWNIPTLVIGRIDTLTYITGKLVIKSPWLGLPNAITGMKFFPELVSWRWGISQKRFDALLHSLLTSQVQQIDLWEILDSGDGAEIACKNCLELLLGSHKKPDPK